MLTITPSIAMQLQHLGWYHPQTGDIDKSVLERYAQHYQIDTQYDQSLQNHISAKRFCHLPDVMPLYVHPPRWQTPGFVVKWHAVGQFPKIKRGDMLAAIQLACQRWNECCGIQLEYTGNSGAAHILITPGRIDGKNNCLAWCEGPNMSAQTNMVIDIDEDWCISAMPPIHQFDLITTVCHELGHGIGIPHIAGTALMAPVYNRSIQKPQIPDQVEAQARYGTVSRT